LTHPITPFLAISASVHVSMARQCADVLVLVEELRVLFEATSKPSSRASHETEQRRRRIHTLIQSIEEAVIGTHEQAHDYLLENLELRQQLSLVEAG
jgi:hypothetical protein